MRRRLALAIAAFLALAATTAGMSVPATASGFAEHRGPGITAFEGPAGGTIDVRRTEGSAGRGGGAGGGGTRPSRPAGPSPWVDCWDRPVLVNPTFVDGLLGPGRAGRVQPTANPVAWRHCTRAATGGEDGWLVGIDLLDGGGAGPVVPATDVLVAHARSQLDLDLPDVATSPPRGGQQLVGVPVWFWVENAEPVSTSAEIPGLSATLTATPAGTEVSVSTDGVTRAGAPVPPATHRCDGGGEAYDPRRHGPWDRSDCSHVFDWNATYEVEVTVTWELSWTASNGEAGSLPVVERTTAFTLAVQEGRAVTD